MKSLDVFKKLFHLACEMTCRSSLRRRPPDQRGKPGELLQRLSPQEREMLSNLKSDDISDEKKLERGEIELAAYPDSYSWNEKCMKDQLSKDKMEFDKKLKK